MHQELLKHTTEEQLREFVRDSLTMLKETNHDLYEELEMHLYKEMYGCHFNEWLLHKATEKMINEDGTIGAHWSLEQTTSVAKQYNVNFVHFNEYDWNYAMNMIYSDFYKAIPNDVSSYVKVARAWIEDKDVKDKAFKYYFYVSK